MIFKEQRYFLYQLLFLALIACDSTSKDPESTIEKDVMIEDQDVVDMPMIEQDQKITIPECSDGIDNDNDGLKDGFDDGCESEDDVSEFTPPPPPACSDGIDNDNDGEIDFPRDLNCENQEDNTENPLGGIPQCTDTIDNDNDGVTDYPIDPGCASANDLDESDDPIQIPECADAKDNDGDQRIDSNDPGCVTVDDRLELNGVNEPKPWCADERDNDGDGFIDFPSDPGCETAGDNDEQDAPFPALCHNEIDDDDDDLIDYPDDPGCAGYGDQSEDDLIYAPHCFDGVDNDFDGNIDYPKDGGCLGKGDDSELGSCGEIYEYTLVRNGELIQGLLNEGSRVATGSCGGSGGKEIAFRYKVRKKLEALIISTDFPQNEVETAIYVRRTCDDANSEVICQREEMDALAAQTLRIDNIEAGDYYIFLDALSNASGAFAFRVDEISISECKNMVDDDFDGYIDFPDDPGCENAYDRDENDPVPTPVCFDEYDNDGDGLSDYPSDYGCLYAGDNDESDICGQGVSVFPYPTDAEYLEGNTFTGGSNRFGGSCGGTNVPEQVYYFEQSYSAQLIISVNYPETQQPTLLYLRKGSCIDDETTYQKEVACSLNGDDGKAILNTGRVPPGQYFLFVDHPRGSGGPFKLSITSSRLSPSCQDSVDDDDDGLIDGEDPGCLDLNDDDEENDAALILSSPPACFNALDDDRDGMIDYPFDAGCISKGDLDERNPGRVPICANRIDDDGDGLIDLDDVDCASRSDETETENRPRPQCSNRLDDDRDGELDYPLDSNCLTVGDLSEFADGFIVACADGMDNDEDGKIDYPLDPGCIAKGAMSETDPNEVPACADMIDNDQDGVTDYPFEPGCTSAADDDETNPSVVPQCGNGIDDDRDRNIDYPNDLQCTSASDSSERN
jgi:hypothetical protein